MTLLLLLAAAAAVQLAVLVRLAPRRPLGDEEEYLARAVAEDPYAPRPFLRPPGTPFLCRLLETEPRLRAAATVAAIVALALTAAATVPRGTATAVLAVALLGFLPERLVLSCHIWPDAGLAVVLAGMLTASDFAAPISPAQAAALGLLAAVAALLRIDALVLAPAVAVSAWWTGVPGAGALCQVLLLLPTALVLLAATVFHGRRYGIFLPDDTWAFNLSIAELATRHRGGHRTIEANVHRAWQDWSVADAFRRWHRGPVSLRRLISAPYRALHDLARRALAFVGPDTFVTEKLLGEGGAYREMSPRLRRLLRLGLRWGFPALFAFGAAGAAVRGSLPPQLWPTLALSLAAIAFHTRTRYRLAVMPGFALLAAEGITAFPAATVGWTASAWWTTLAVTLLAVVLLGRIRTGRELEGPTDVSDPGG